MNIQQNLIGFIVGAVDVVAKIVHGNISDPPKITTDDANDFLIGIAKLQNKVVLLLDTKKF